MADITVPKTMLPDCAVGETVEMTITGEDEENFILSPAETEAPEEEAAEEAPPKKAAPKRAKAVSKALEMPMEEE